MAGLKQGAQLVGWIRRAAHDHCQVAFEDLYLAGPVIDGLTVDVVSKRTLDSYAIPSTLVVFYICYLCLGSLRGALLVVSLSVVGQGVTLSLVHYAGDEMSALLIGSTMSLLNQRGLDGQSGPKPECDAWQILGALTQTIENE